MTTALSVSAATFDVAQYGAKPDGSTDNTAAIQLAIDECSAKGGGRVTVSGGVYITYTLNLRNNVELHIERGATLKGGEDPFKYPLFETNSVWNAERSPRFNRRAMFYTVGQTNVAITGAGTIDGSAEKFHHEEAKTNWTGYRWFRNSDTNITGRCVFFVGCKDVRLDDVLILHPSGWSTWFLDCDRVGVRGVRVEADRRFPNGDGLHFGGCRDVVVSDCVINSQDDAFIVRTHQEQMKVPRPCERVVVSNCILNSYGAFAIRVGWRGDGPVKDVSFDNITSTHSRWGIGFTVPSAPKGEDKDPPRGRGLVPPPPESLLPFSVENVRFSNMSIVCDNRLNLITFGTTTPIAFIKDVSFSHCRFRSPAVPAIKFRPQDNVMDWNFSDVVFEFNDKSSPQELFKDIKDVELNNVKCVYYPGKVFWNMELEVDGEEKPIPIESVEQTFDAQEGRLVYGPLKRGERTFDIRVTLDIQTTPEGKTYTGFVENNAKGVRVVKFNGPKLDSMAVNPAKAALYIPGGFGRRLRYFPLDAKDAAPWTKVGNVHMALETGLYPSRDLTMPWVALDTGNGTFYAAVHDPKARAKTIGIRWTPNEKHADVRFRHPVSIRTGERWELPETVFARMPGDWHDAAKRYRAWYDSTRPAVMSAALAWPRDLTGWLLVIMKQQNEELMWPYTDIPKLCDVAERNGLNCIGLFGWTVGGHDHLYPDYDPDPKMGGAEALKAGIAEAHRRGIRVCIYANGQLQQIGATKFWDEYGKHIALTKRDGSFLIQTYHKYKDIPVYQFALGCLYGGAWSDRMSALARQAAGFGADAILYDQQGVMRPFECWGEGHGHPVPWYAYAEERPVFLRGIADGVRKTNPEFSVFTEGLHDSILDTIGFFHSWTPGAFLGDAQAVRGRAAETPAKADPFPEMFRYTFPEIPMTTRFSTPMAPRTLANYVVTFGLRHEIEIRYMQDRVYVLDGKVPTREDYGEVVSLPNIGEMQRTPQSEANAYLKSVCDFQKKYSKYLLRGRFVDEEGFTVRLNDVNGGDARSSGDVVAKRFVADDGTSAVCVWNISDRPLSVKIAGLGTPKGVFAPVAPFVRFRGKEEDSTLAPDSILLYVY